MSQLKLKISTAQIDNEIIFRWVSDFNSMCLLRRSDAHFDGRELIIDAHDISVFIEVTCPPKVDPGPIGLV